MAWLMDEVIRSLMLEAESRAGKILERLAQALLAEEVVDGARGEAVVGHLMR